MHGKIILWINLNKMIRVDTNYIVRYLVNDNIEMADIAEEILTSKNVFISNEILAEVDCEDNRLEIVLNERSDASYRYLVRCFKTKEILGYIGLHLTWMWYSLDGPPPKLYPYSSLCLLTEAAKNDSTSSVLPISPRL